MASGRQIHKKGQANSTVTPKTGLMRSRPFAEPPQPQSVSTPEVQTKVESGQTASNLSRLNLSASPPIQPKLTIGAPGDKYEQEADAIARQVVTQISYPTHDNSTGEPVQRQTQPSISRLTVQRQEAIGGGTASAELESTISRAKGGGAPLAEPIRRQMEGAFGSDFSGVRVHTNSTSDTLNRSLSARAFTTGNNIFFKQGEYNPGSSSGQELLAHELTHVVQQSHGTVRRNTIQRKKDNLPPIPENLVASKRLSVLRGPSKTKKINDGITKYNAIPLMDIDYRNQKEILVEIISVGQEWLKEHSKDTEGKKETNQSWQESVKSMKADLSKGRIEEIAKVITSADVELNTVMAQEEAKKDTQGMPKEKNSLLSGSEEGIQGGLAGFTATSATLGEEARKVIPGPSLLGTGPSLREKLQIFLESSKNEAKNNLENATKENYGLGDKISGLLQVLKNIPLGSIAGLAWNLKEAYKAWVSYHGLVTAKEQEDDAIRTRDVTIDSWTYKGYVWGDVTKAKADEEIQKAKAQGNDELRDAYEHGAGKVRRSFWTKIQNVASKIVDIIAYILIATGVGSAVGAILKLATQVVEIAELVYRKIKGIYKAVTKQRGVHRKESAEKIVYAALRGDARAIKALVAIRPLDGVDEAKLIHRTDRSAKQYLSTAINPFSNIIKDEKTMKDFLQKMKANSAEAGMNINEFIEATAEKLKSQ